MNVRINAPATPHWQVDVEACSALDVVDALEVPTVESAAEFDRVQPALVRTLPLQAPVETPRRIQAVDEIATAGFERLLFGAADYCAAVGAPPSNDLFAYTRARPVVASAVGGLPIPVDGPTTVFDDLAQLRRDLNAARTLGMGGKLCVHSTQLSGAREAFAPSDVERAWATRLVDAAEFHRGAAFSLDGQMIDEPVVERAMRILRS